MRGLLICFLLFSHVTTVSAVEGSNGFDNANSTQDTLPTSASESIQSSEQESTDDSKFDNEATGTSVSGRDGNSGTTVSDYNNYYGTESSIQESNEIITEESSSQEPNMSNQTTNIEYYGVDENGEYSLPRNRSDIDISSSRVSLPRISANRRDTPTKSFIDVSSHNGKISVTDFKIMKSYGVLGVSVKLSEGTSYINPEAKEQIENAKAAGLQVSAYHYSWFKTDAQAVAEANYFVAVVKELGLPKDTVLVNDIEEPKIAGTANHTQNSKAFEKQLNQLGYSKVRHYIGLYWLNSGLINGDTLGNKNIWVAAYPNNLSQANLYSTYGAWQWSSQIVFPGVSGTFDISSDYTNSFSSDETLINYSSHLQYFGWQESATNNQVSGTVGEGRRIEAIRLAMVNKNVGGIEYQTHIQNIGWDTEWKKNGQISGTTGQGKRLEALKIRLTGDISLRYDVFYRVHSQRFGWLNWAKNGEASGTEGFAYRLEGIQVILVPKGDSAPSGSGKAFIKFQNYNVSYQSHIQYRGWGPTALNGATSGSVGQGLRMEAVRIQLPENPLNLPGNIEYQTHVQNTGWQNWKMNNATSGTEGRGLRAEAIRIRLSGSLASHYDVYYRSHSQIYGWLGWTKNGAASGTQGLGKRLEAIEIIVVRKDSNPPGLTGNPFIIR